MDGEADLEHGRGATHRFLSHALIKSLLVAFVVFLDPFGLDSTTSRASQEIVLRLMAPFYPTMPPAPITVALIDEDTLDYAGMGFPLDDGTLGDLIGKVACGGAVAVFVDLLLGAVRPGGPRDRSAAHRSAEGEDPRAGGSGTWLGLSRAAGTHLHGRPAPR